MAGLHFSCDDWLGEDKSANVFFDILHDDLGKYVTAEEQAAWRTAFWVPYIRQSRSRRLRLTPAMMQAIIEPLRRYGEELARRVSVSGPTAPLTEFGEIHECSPEDMRFICVRDLLLGYEVCQRTGKPIVVYHA